MSLRSYIDNILHKLVGVEPDIIGNLSYEEYFKVHNKEVKRYFFDTGNCPICGSNNWAIISTAASYTITCKKCKEIGHHVQFNVVSPYHFEYIPPDNI